MFERSRNLKDLAAFEMQVSVLDKRNVVRRNIFNMTVLNYINPVTNVLIGLMEVSCCNTLYLIHFQSNAQMISPFSQKHVREINFAF